MKVILYYDPICRAWSTELELLDCHEGGPHYGIRVEVEVEPPDWPDWPDLAVLELAEGETE